MLSLLSRLTAATLFDVSLAAGLVPGLLNFFSPPQRLTIKDPVGISRRISEPWAVLRDSRDPQAEVIVQGYLKSLKALGLSTKEQGVWLQSGLFRLADHQGQTPLSAASLTKIATSLAALETWGPQHQFATDVLTNGTIQNGVVQGDLIIQGSGDPMFVWEEAIALGNALNRLGIKQVTGNLVITGNFVMNFEWDPIKSGNLLKQALNSATWQAQIQVQHGKMTAGTPKPKVAIAGNVVRAQPTQGQLLVKRKSLPLWNLVKRLNVYSNNFMSEALSRLMGGPPVVIKTAAAAAGVAPDQIRLINGSGLGEENRISAQAASAMFAAIQRYASLHQLNIADLFPISGTDVGTIEDREIPRNAVVKTGSLSVVSALAGVVPTNQRGVISFAIINRGSNLEGLRASQDTLLRKLQQAWGAPTKRPVEISPIAPAQDEMVKLGTMSRNFVPAPKS
ncbi:D-alanyl-D-alanine carboxypeptidase [filamentous cyanobacterium LEGE 11480]|uniref:D-alanyl-D-alanine carboxypeptidase n=1 Tax=Romeriopsis navalis LEGE 11480 TaxID=2777977 RepID=A0A928VJG4_9CYAN|nr:D-alanyl-D-alanine carboxypeptidase [Romeriopsis navalis]MBE9029460.1 D-alanyl-D-alanine carboxypeptidase [Romeriopsis navalis LEGE 11480]